MAKQKVLSAVWWEEYERVFQATLTAFRALVMKVRKQLSGPKLRDFEKLRQKFREGKATAPQIVAWAERNAPEIRDTVAQIYEAISADDMFADPGTPEPLVRWVRENVPGEENAFQAAYEAESGLIEEVYAGFDPRTGTRLMDLPAWYPGSPAYCVVKDVIDLAAKGLCETATCAERGSHGDDGAWMCDQTWASFSRLDSGSKGRFEAAWREHDKGGKRSGRTKQLDKDSLLAFLIPFWVSKDSGVVANIASAYVDVYLKPALEAEDALVAQASSFDQTLATFKSGARKSPDRVAASDQRRRAQAMLASQAAIAKAAAKTAKNEVGNMAIMSVLLEDLAYVWHFEDKRAGHEGTIFLLWPDCPQARGGAFEPIAKSAAMSQLAEHRQRLRQASARLFED